MERRAPVPGRQVRHRDAVPAPGVRGVRAQGPAEDRRIPVHDVDRINPAIVAEFAHTVYRFGHSMLTETVDRLDPNFNVERASAWSRPSSIRWRSPRGGAVRPTTARRRHRARHDPPGSATRSTSSSPRRCATTCSACRSTCRPSTWRAAATPACRRSTRRAATSTSMTSDSQLKPYVSWARPRQEPEAPGIGHQLHCGLRHACRAPGPRRRHARGEARGCHRAGSGRQRRHQRWRRGGPSGSSLRMRSTASPS